MAILAMNVPIIELINPLYVLPIPAFNKLSPLIYLLKLSKPTNNLPYQLFQQIDRLERHLRLGSAYPVSDDGQSPNAFVTGRGLRTRPICIITCTRISSCT